MTKDFIQLSGFKEFKEGAKNFKRIFDQELKKELMDVALEAEGYAKALVYRDEGTLENSIHTTNITKMGNRFVVYVGTNMEYATYLHELYNPHSRGDKYDKGVLDRGYYLGGRGRRTREKPFVKGYMPGRKFLSNAVEITEPIFEEAMGRALENALRKV